MTAYSFPPRPSLDDVGPMRTARLASLTALPELFVELAVRHSAVHAIEHAGLVGYLTVQDDTLTEFFVDDEHRTHSDAILLQAADALGLAQAWACTFDPVALAACTATARPYEVPGLSFRAMNAVALPAPDPLPTERLATVDDIEQIRAANHPKVFDDPADITTWVAQGWVTLFELPGGLAGFGLCTPAGPYTLACDIGIRVCPPHQRRGLGAWIVQRLAARAHAQGLVPTAGCSADNTISRRTLERAGFVADHRLLQFRLPA